MQNAAHVVVFCPWRQTWVSSIAWSCYLKGHTFDWLRLKEILDGVVHAGGWECMIDAMRQILKHYFAWKLGVFALQLRTLMTNSTTNINKDWQLRIPPFCFGFNRIHREPCGHSCSSSCHVSVEITECFGLLREELEHWLFSVPCILEWCFCIVGDILKPVFSEKSWGCLVDRPDKIKTSVSCQCEQVGCVILSELTSDEFRLVARDLQELLWHCC